MPKAYLIARIDRDRPRALRESAGCRTRYARTRTRVVIVEGVDDDAAYWIAHVAVTDPEAYGRYAGSPREPSRGTAGASSPAPAATCSSRAGTGRATCWSSSRASRRRRPATARPSTRPPSPTPGRRRARSGDRRGPLEPRHAARCPGGDSRGAGRHATLPTPYIRGDASVRPAPCLRRSAKGRSFDPGRCERRGVGARHAAPGGGYAEGVLLRRAPAFTATRPGTFRNAAVSGRPEHRWRR